MSMEKLDIHCDRWRNYESHFSG